MFLHVSPSLPSPSLSFPVSCPSLSLPPATCYAWIRMFCFSVVLPADILPTIKLCTTAKTDKEYDVQGAKHLSGWNIHASGETCWYHLLDPCNFMSCHLHRLASYRCHRSIIVAHMQMLSCFANRLTAWQCACFSMCRLMSSLFTS